MAVNNRIETNTVSFCFAWLTSEKNFNIAGLKSKKRSGQEQKELFELLEHLQIWSSASFGELKARGKREDGFEVMKVREFSHPVFENFPFEPDPETEAAVFRFGNYRMAALFRLGISEDEKADFLEEDVFYTAAFDWDFSLYPHGS